MTQDALKKLSDSELAQMIAFAQAEAQERADQRKRLAIAKIRELAATVGVAVSIGNKRGRAHMANGATKAEHGGRTTQGEK